MTTFRYFLCLCLAALSLMGSLGAQELLEGNPERARLSGPFHYRDSTGKLLRTRSFSYEVDSLSGEALVHECISDTNGRVAVIINRYDGSRLVQKDEYDGEDRLLKRTRYAFVTLDGAAYPTEITVENLQSTPSEYGSSIVYSDQDGHHYPLEIVRWQSGHQAERVRYTYPFCADDAFGPMADSLLARGMPDAILSLTHWRDSVRTDSTAVRYGFFPGADTSYLRPEVLLFAEGNEKMDTCVRYLAYDSLGRQPLLVKDRKSASFRALDPRRFRWMAPDPAEERLRVLRAYDYCASDPSLDVDAFEGENFLFDQTGLFLCRVQSARVRNQVIFWQGYGNEPLTARFADPVHDPADVGLDTRVELRTADDIRSSLEKAGAFDPAHHGLFKGCFYIFRNSRYGGLLDFAVNDQHDIFNQLLYITRTTVEGNVAHNNYNYGNLLWGATACELGIPLFMACLGAHFNNFFLSPDTKFTFDAKDDQFSIRCGYHWK